MGTANHLTRHNFPNVPIGALITWLTRFMMFLRTAILCPIPSVTNVVVSHSVMINCEYLPEQVLVNKKGNMNL